MHEHPVRICILCKNDVMPLWLAKALEKLVNEKLLSISLIAVTIGCSSKEKKTMLEQILGFCRHSRVWLYGIYCLVTAVLKRNINNASTPTSIAHLCMDAPRVFIRCIRANGGLQVAQEDLCALKDRDLDLIICCGVAPINLEVSDIAPQGAWYVEDSEDPYLVDAQRGTWEVLDGYPILKMEIKRRVVANSQPEILCHSFLPTYLRDDLWPVHGVRDVKLWTASAWLRRLIVRFYRFGPMALVEKPVPAKTLHPTVEQKPKLPDNRQMAVSVMKKLRRTFRRVIGRENLFDEWHIAFLLDDQVPLESLPGSEFSVMAPPKGFFWADPVPFKYENSYFIFLEELEYASGKGHISVIQMDTTGAWKPPVKVLERPHHLSYPFVFDWEGEFYMTPETASCGRIELYKADSFPFEWKLEEVLLDNVKAVDPTLTFQDNSWWMFFATMPYEELEDDNFMELNIFYAESPYGPWFPHRRNPVKSDARNSRPAGGLFVSNANLLRPAQDCLRAYGNAISINVIEKLTKEEFREREVARIEPSLFDKALRIHTIGRCEGLTVVDLAVRVRDK